MAFKGSGPVLFLLLATVFILGAYAADYQTFLRQHYDKPKSNVRPNYCDGMMKKRKMAKPKCKEVNSFIHETKNSIIDVCGVGGKPYGNGLQRSLKQFTVTTCKLKGSSTKPPCTYRENSSERHIVIACQNKKPVHYDEGQI